ncbi:GNAT family N-acetyltransferase [Paenibacillus sp. strain BS8-2]
MSSDNKETGVSFYNLRWDSDYFGVSCAKAILYKSVSISEWKELKNRFLDYTFVSIENRNSDDQNKKLLEVQSSIFLADTNVQFSKHIINKSGLDVDGITSHKSLGYNQSILDMSDFKYSKFIKDLELKRRGGALVYRQWLINAFDRPDKFFILSRDEEYNINGYLLYSFVESIFTIELIAVSMNAQNQGIGKKMLIALENNALKRGVKEIRVGTQLENIQAINFYKKVGFNQVSKNETYHLWK